MHDCIFRHKVVRCSSESIGCGLRLRLVIVCCILFLWYCSSFVCLLIFFVRFVFSVVLSWFVLVCLISFCHNLPLWYVLCFFVQCHFAMFARSMQYELKWTKNRFCFVSWTWMLLNLVFFFISFSSVVCTVHISRRPFYKNSFFFTKISYNCFPFCRFHSLA